MKKTKKKKSEYPRIEQLGIIVQQEPVHHILFEDLDKALDKAGLDKQLFNKLFGVQTMYILGLYPWDVEAVLERMLSGKLTGTQLYWD